MITINDEQSQVKYGYTSGCACCGTKDLQADIKEIQFAPNYYSKTIIICKACRDELQNVLQEHDGAINTVSEIIETPNVETRNDETANIDKLEMIEFEDNDVSENIETNNTAPNAFETENVYAKEMNARIDLTKYLDPETIASNNTELEVLEDIDTETSEVETESVSDIESEPNFDIEAWADSLIEENEKEKHDTDASDIISNAVTKVLEPEAPQTYDGEKLRSLKLISNKPIRYMCINCELDFDNDDMEYAKKEGTCPYCSVDLTEEVESVSARICICKNRKG